MNPCKPLDRGRDSSYPTLFPPARELCNDAHRVPRRARQLRKERTMPLGMLGQKIGMTQIFDA